jgi:hypothetical protein
VELELAWKRVAREVAEGTLGGEFDKSDRAELQSNVKDSEVAAKDGVWGDYRFAVVADGQEADGLKAIDLGAGQSSSGETLCGRVIAALKSEALLNESVGVGYIERNWPPALKDSGAWPLASLRQSFLSRLSGRWKSRARRDRRHAGGDRERLGRDCTRVPSRVPKLSINPS